MGTTESVCDDPFGGYKYHPNIEQEPLIYANYLHRNLMLEKHDIDVLKLYRWLVKPINGEEGEKYNRIEIYDIISNRLWITGFRGKPGSKERTDEEAAKRVIDQLSSPIVKKRIWHPKDLSLVGIRYPMIDIDRLYNNLMQNGLQQYTRDELLSLCEELNIPIKSKDSDENAVARRMLKYFRDEKLISC